MTGQDSASSLAACGRTLVEALGGRWTARGGVCRCPAHDDHKPSLSIRIGRSRLLFHCFAGCDTRAVLRALAAVGLDSGADAPAAGGGPPASRGATLAAAATRLWGTARPAAGTPAENYLADRGLDASSPELRFHPRTPLGPRPFTRFRPALIAAVRDEAGLVAVHRTFLDGKLPGSGAASKCALGPLGSGVVRLGEAAPRLGLAEGIETALSASLLFGIPCWATLGTERFRHVALPKGISELVLFLDNDAGGRRAEALARSVHAGRRSIEVRYPRHPGADWNDVLRERNGARGC